MKTAFRNLALLVPSIVVGLLLFEVIVRQVAPQILFEPRRDMWEPSPTVAYRHVANADTETNLYGPLVHFVTDENGYRVDSTSSPPDCDPDVRVLMLGDSFVEGLKVDEDQTISVLTRQLLGRDHGICAEIDNSGVSGWNPNHYFIEARRALDEREYDAGVVFFYIANDVINAEVDSFPPQLPTPVRRFRIPRSLRGGELVDALVKPVNDVLRSSSHGYLLVRDRIRQMARSSTASRYFPDIYRRDFVDAPKWSVTATVCEKIQREFDDRNLPVVFVFIPAFFQVVTSHFDTYVSNSHIDPSSVDVIQPNVILARELRRRGLRVLDPLEEMREEARQGVDMYGGWDAHFSVEGNVFMADYVAPVLARMLNPHVPEGQ